MVIQGLTAIPNSERQEYLRHVHHVRLIEGHLRGHSVADIGPGNAIDVLVVIGSAYALIEHDLLKSPPFTGK